MDPAAVVEDLGTVVVVTDASGTIRLANRAAAGFFGRPEADLVGAPLTSLMPERFREAHLVGFSRFVASGVGDLVGGPPITVVALRADGTEVETELTLTLVEADPSDESAGAPMVAAAMRDESAHRVELMARLAASQRSQTFLLRATDVLAQASGYADTLEQLAGVAVPTLGDLCLIDVFDVEGRLMRMAARHADPLQQPLADELRYRYAPRPRGPHPTSDVSTTGVSRWSADMTEQFLRDTTQDEHHYELVTQLHFTSYMSVPLTVGDDVLGVVTIVSAGSGRRFGPPDLALAEELAGRVALVVAKARRYDAEHDIAGALQSRLLPTKIAQVAGLQAAVRYLPGTRGVQVGGDFFDVIPGDREVTLIVGDVEGHDVTAAATMGQLRSACRAFATQAAGPAELLGLLARNWEVLDFDRLATAVVARYDLTTHELRVASCGHPSPVLVCDDIAAFLPLDPGPPLGAGFGAPAEWQGLLPSGSGLLCYTDGLVEDHGQDIDVGLAALLKCCREARTTHPEKLCDAVLSALAREHRGDDVALLAVSPS